VTRDDDDDDDDDNNNNNNSNNGFAFGKSMTLSQQIRDKLYISTTMSNVHKNL
jgi:hypothetical protein